MRDTALSVPALTAAQREYFVLQLHGWYEKNARRLPWRETRDPYRIWVSEIMLQQTRVNAVLDHYARFLESFPTVFALALALESEVLAHWSGLGYYRRARMMHRTAKLIVEELHGKFPRTAEGLRRLPGIGMYTSAAIASIAWNEPVAVVDGNVERVLLRVLGQPQTKGAAAAEFLQSVAQSLTPNEHPGDHNQAMMELGATVCVPSNPHCEECPVLPECRTRGEHVREPRARMQSQRVAYGLTTRRVRNSAAVEILLQRRPSDASLMPEMLELPRLASPDVMEDSEPLLRVRHSIVGTNYYVEIHGVSSRQKMTKYLERRGDMEWASSKTLEKLPLTGLTRKTLQRLRFMRTVAGPLRQRLPLVVGKKKDKKA